VTGVIKRFWRPETGIFLGIWFGLMIGGQTRLLRDPGTFWHTRVGERILNTRQFIDTDPFSCTFGGRPWVPHQWLGECVMAVVHKLDGLDSLLLATVTLLACLYTWVAHRLIRCGLHWSLTVCIVGLTMAASSLHFHVRPHLITIVLLGWTVARLVDFEAGRVELRQLFWLVPAYALWSNIHGGVLGGLVTLGLVLAGWIGAAIVRWPTPFRDFRQAVWFALLILACGLTAFVNPYGWRLPAVWFSIMGSPRLGQIIVEHAPLDPTAADGIVVLMFGAIYLLVLAGIGFRRPRITWLLPLPWFALACSSVRHAPLFAITAAVALTDLLPHTFWARWLARPGSDLFRFPDAAAAASKPSLDWRPALLPAAVVVVTLVLQVAGLSVPVLGHGWHRLDPSYWPVDDLPDGSLISALREYEGDGTPIFNDLTFGGYLIYFTPGYHVFIDDRCELYANERQYGRELLTRYDHVMRTDPTDFDRLLTDFRPDVRLVLVSRESPLAQYLRRPASGWRLTAESESSAFFVRRTADAVTSTR
jgi:hypothetical protein